MKSTNFSKHLSKFFKIYLHSECNMSKNTIISYSYSFSEFLKFMKNNKKIEASKIELCDFNRKNIQEFLNNLQEKGKSESTINQRKSALSSFCKYLRYEEPSLATEIDLILSIKRRKVQRKTISYMKVDGINLFLQQIDMHKKIGLRDFVMMSLMLTVGLRVSELINTKVKDINLNNPPTIKVNGKGRKERIVVIPKKLIDPIKKYISINNFDLQENIDNYLFLNHSGKQFTRQGVGYIVIKYREKARLLNIELIPSDLSCHKLRHSCGAAMASSGVDITTIKDVLGHESIETTQIYVGVSELEEKEDALNKVVGKIFENTEDIKAVWNDDIELLDFLENLKK